MKWVRLGQFYHQRRFFLLSFLLVLSLGWYIDGKPLWDEFARLQEQENNTSLLLAEKQQALQQAGPMIKRLQALQLVKTKKPLLDRLLQAAQSNLCQVASLQTELKKNDNQPLKQPDPSLQSKQLIINMHLYCNFVSFYRLLDTLIQQALPVRLDRFTVSNQANDGLDMVVEFSAFPWALGLVADKTNSDTGPETCCVRDPFHDAPLVLFERTMSQQEDDSDV